MKSHSAAVLQALLVVILWATSWVFIKVGLQEMPPLIFAGLRYSLAFVCLLMVLLSSNSKRDLQVLSGREWGRLFTLGLLYYAGTQGATFVALAYLPAVTVNLLWSFSSVAVALLGIFWLSEIPTLLQWGGITLAVTGALIYFYPASIPAAQTIGVMVAILGVLTNAASSIMGRGINRSGKIPPLIVTVVSMGAGAIPLLACGLILEDVPPIGLKSWAIIAWLAVVNTAFAFTLWNHTLRRLTAMESSIINGTMLIWIPIFAVAFLGEEISARQIAGLIVVGMGTLIVQSARNQTAVRKIP